MFKGRVPYTDDDAFDWRHRNIGRLLLNAYSYFEQALLLRFHEIGYTEIRPVHLSVMRQMDMEGTRLTVIAVRAGVTKQAMSTFVQECETLGFVDRIEDPGDGRAKIVRFTERGRKFMADTRAVLAGIETEVEKTLGRKRLEDIRTGLEMLGQRLVQEDVLLNEPRKQKTAGVTRPSSRRRQVS